MEKNALITWEKVGRKVENNTFDKVAELDAICFVGEQHEKMHLTQKIYGDIYVLKVYDFIIGYAIYGQLWLPEHSDAYITRIGVHPQHRQLGWGHIMLENILSDLNARAMPGGSAVYADIRKSNTASQNLFRKAGFHVYFELHDVYNDETALRVRKST